MMPWIRSIRQPAGRQVEELRPGHALRPAAAAIDVICRRAVPAGAQPGRGDAAGQIRQQHAHRFAEANARAPGVGDVVQVFGGIGYAEFQCWCASIVLAGNRNVGFDAEDQAVAEAEVVTQPGTARDVIKVYLTGVDQVAVGEIIVVCVGAGKSINPGNADVSTGPVSGICLRASSGHHGKGCHRSGRSRDHHPHNRTPTRTYT
jgi:hypothetical protein